MEGVLAFAEHLARSAARIWTEGNLEQRQRLQRALLPDGLSYRGTGFGTART